MLVLVFCAFALRAWRLSSIGIDHFDEAVYAFSALGITDPSQPHQLYPQQVKFSPPAHFSLIGLAYLMSGGASDTAAVLVSVVLGTLTVAAVWWAGRCWFGPAAGIAAAALLCFNEYHIGLSRSVLTDVTFACFFVAGLAALAAAVERRSLARGVLAGVVIGLAWNTKYHGWFAAAIGAAALPVFWWQSKTWGPRLVGSLTAWGVAAVTAAVCYLPWTTLVQFKWGGYQGLVKYQRTLISSDWRGGLIQQAKWQYFLEGPLTMAAPLAALLFVLWYQDRLPARPGRWVAAVLLCTMASLAVGGAGALVILAALAVPLVVRRGSYSGWVLLAWLGVWVVMAPFYKPYSRLILPFTIATQLAAGVWLAWAAAGESEEQPKEQPWSPLLAAGAVMIVVGVSLWLPDRSNPWRASDGMRSAAAAMTQVIPEGQRVIVIAEPAAAYYLHLSGRPAFERLEDMDLLAKIDKPVYVVTSVYTDRAPPLRDGIAKLSHRLKLLGTFPVVPAPKDIRVTDDFKPAKARLFLDQPDHTYDFKVYLMSPEPGAS